MALENKERAKELLEKSSSETVKYYEDGKRQIHLQIDKKDGESVAFLEVPKYIPEEIEKALDINVDELVRNRKDLPEVVLKSLYDDKLEELRIANQTIQDLEIQVADLESLLAQRTAERDNEIERRISAELALAELENLYIALSDQFAQTVFELQKAIERSTQEAIERVSLEARFEAIKAQLNASLIAIEVAEDQTELAQQTNYLNSTLIEEGEMFVWKIPQRNIRKPDFSGFFLKYANKSCDAENGEEVVFYNFSSSPMTVTVTRNHPDGASSGQSQSMWFPNSFTIPAGSGEINSDTGRVAVPGFTTVKAGFKRPGGYKEDNTTGWRRKPETGLTFTTNTGETLSTFKYRYSRPYKVQGEADDAFDRQFTIKEGIDVSL